MFNRRCTRPQHASPTLVPLSVTVETALRRGFANTPASGPLAQLIARQAEAFAQELNDNYCLVKLTPACLTTQSTSDTIAGVRDRAWLGRWRGDQRDLADILSIEDGWLHERIDASGKPTRVVTRIHGGRF